MAYKKKSGGTGSRKSTAHKVALSAAAAAGGAIAGAALGKLGLLGGIGLMIAGTIQNNPMLTIAGAAAAVAPGALNTSEKSSASGVKGYFQDGVSSVKKLAANVLPKTGINIVFPNAFPALQLGEVDASYYDGGGQSAMAAEAAFNRALNMSGTDVSGFDGEDDMGRLMESGYQTAEVDGDVSGIAGFKETAAQASVLY